jgi:5'-methylthioadenosine phosphorylase
MKERFAIIGGSGAYDLLKKEGFGVDLECRKVITPFGESAPIHRFKFPVLIEGREINLSFLFMSRHGENGYEISAPFVNYRANIWALKEYGAERIISWSGPGIINKRYSVGDFALPDDIIDETKGRDYTFFNGTGIGFIRQSHPFCPEIREGLSDALKEGGEKYHSKAVYVCTQGPRLETAAEIRKFRTFGGDIVGMTLVPELFLSRELEVCYASLCYLTNFAEGVKDRDYTADELFEGMQNNDEKERVDTMVLRFSEIIRRTLKKLSLMERNCMCKNAMGRYKKRGDIGDDWHMWIGR